LNTRKFRGAGGVPNIVFLPATADPILKRRFLNTCDGMLHGRMRGETFGLSCLEFAMLGKPVLTYAESPERAHLEVLGGAAVAYRDAQDLREYLEDRGRWSVAGGRRTEAGGRRAEDGGQRTKGGSQWSVVSGRRSEGRGQRAEDGGQKSVVGSRKSEGERPQQPTTNDQQPIRSHRALDSRFSQYQSEAVMGKFKQVFLQ